MTNRKEIMETNFDSYYQAVLTHDVRFDGAFFVGVSTTGVYCRTVCTAKTPRQQNCTFFPSAAAAEKAGYRPCLRCRPELAPGNARIDAVNRLAASIANRIEDGELVEKRVDELATEFGISERHLRRVIKSEFGVSPIELAQTQRLLLAKRLLTDTNLSVTEIAFASGFSSLRRFNALFKERYNLNPTGLRKTTAKEVPNEILVCELSYRPPFDWAALLKFLGNRALDGIEWIDNQSYLRTISIGKYAGWIKVEPSKNKPVLLVELPASLAPVLLQILARVKRLFDLATEPQQIVSHLGKVASENPGLRVPGAFEGFETALRAILGQQVSVKAASTLASRFTTTFGEKIETPFEKLTQLSPTANRVASLKLEEITQLGIIAARANSILSLAQAVANKDIILEPGVNVPETLTKLKQLPGIGEWTAQYIAMRILAWPDAFPHTDLGIYKALDEHNPKKVLELAENWKPWRAYAAIHLWNSLERKI